MHHFLHIPSSNPLAAQAPPLIFLPGWGFTGSILELDPLLSRLPRNLIVTSGQLDPDCITEDLAAFLDHHKHAQIDLAGWSMGAYSALEFSNHYPDKTNRLYLLAMRANWPQNEISRIDADLTANRQKTMSAFYRKCFIGHKQAYKKFTAAFEARYLKEMDIDLLRKGLKFLARATTKTLRPSCPTTQLHGRRDIVAPADQRAIIPGTDTILVTDSGHALFLSPTFHRLLLPRITKEGIRQKFSSAAATYDQHATIQKTAGELLTARIPADGQYSTILELGCGTGHLTSQLASLFTESRILALDFSSAMLAQAQSKLPGSQVELLCVDGEQFVATTKGRFDLIISNACLQWFSDLETAFRHIAELLTPEGLFTFSVFGPRTLQELKAGLAAAFQRDIPLPASSFPDEATIRALLEKYFPGVAAEKKIIHRQYNSLKDLLLHIKKTGTSGAQSQPPPIFTRKRIAQLDQWFTNHYNGYHLSYEIFFFRVSK